MPPLSGIVPALLQSAILRFGVLARKKNDPTLYLFAVARMAVVAFVCIFVDAKTVRIYFWDT